MRPGNYGEGIKIFGKTSGFFILDFFISMLYFFIYKKRKQRISL